MGKFKKGDRAIIVNTPLERINGTEVTVTSDGTFMYNEYFPDGTTVYTVDLKISSKDNCDLVGLPESCLRPIYDGDTKVEWADCAFQPSDVKVT